MGEAIRACGEMVNQFFFFFKKKETKEKKKKKNYKKKLKIKKKRERDKAKSFFFLFLEEKFRRQESTQVQQTWRALACHTFQGRTREVSSCSLGTSSPMF